MAMLRGLRPYQGVSEWSCTNGTAVFRSHDFPALLCFVVMTSHFPHPYSLSFAPFSLLPGSSDSVTFQLHLLEGSSNVKVLYPDTDLADSPATQVRVCVWPSVCACVWVWGAEVYLTNCHLYFSFVILQGQQAAVGVVGKVLSAALQWKNSEGRVLSGTGVLLTNRRL